MAETLLRVAVAGVEAYGPSTTTVIWNEPIKRVPRYPDGSNLGGVVSAYIGYGSGFVEIIPPGPNAAVLRNCGPAAHSTEHRKRRAWPIRVRPGLWT